MNYINYINNQVTKVENAPPPQVLGNSDVPKNKFHIVYLQPTIFTMYNISFLFNFTVQIMTA